MNKRNGAKTQWRKGIFAFAWNGGAERREFTKVSSLTVSNGNKRESQPTNTYPIAPLRFKFSRPSAISPQT